MDEKFINNFTKIITNSICSIAEHNIEAIELGFINDDCDIIILNMLRDCVENAYIFKEQQFANIVNLINKISYE